jgi:hypothetical protein
LPKSEHCGTRNDTGLHLLWECGESFSDGIRLIIYEHDLPTFMGTGSDGFQFALSPATKDHLIRAREVVLRKPVIGCPLHTSINLINSLGGCTIRTGVGSFASCTVA